MEVDEYGVDLEEITRVIEKAEVLVVRFQIIDKRLLVDFRVSERSGPLFKAVAPASSVEARFRSLRTLRPDFALPDQILSFLWPRGVGAFADAGVLRLLADRLEAARPGEVAQLVKDTYGELLHEEAETLRAAIRGGEGFQTLWERSD